MCVDVCMGSGPSPAPTCVCVRLLASVSIVGVADRQQSIGVVSVRVDGDPEGVEGDHAEGDKLESLVP